MGQPKEDYKYTHWHVVNRLGLRRRQRWPLITLKRVSQPKNDILVLGRCWSINSLNSFFHLSSTYLVRSWVCVHYEGIPPYGFWFTLYCGEFTKRNHNRKVAQSILKLPGGKEQSQELWQSKSTVSVEVYKLFKNPWTILTLQTPPIAKIYLLDLSFKGTTVLNLCSWKTYRELWTP